MFASVAAKEVRHALNSQFAVILALIFVIALPVPVYWSNSATNVFVSGLADLTPFFGQLPLFLMVFIPALAMRAWAGERGAGTYELLMSYPLRPRDLVLGKFLGNFALCAFCLLATLAVPILLNRIGNPDHGPIIGGYAAALLLSAACLSAALFVGSLTRNHITAFILAFLVLAMLMFVNLPAVNFHARFTNIARGIVDTRDLAFYGLVTVGFLYLNVKRIEWGRW
ncbi:MAG: ABC transporter permease subunit [Acidobacteriota bacterium]|nr:ABC transporter permease subunit [Acidobacteriota bacterium]